MSSESNFSPLGSSPTQTLDDAIAMASKYILITNATGNQGSSVVDALAKNPGFTLLCQTRNTTSAGAQKLAAKGQNIKLIEGSLDNVPALFKTAQDATAGSSIWGVYSVQISLGKGVTHDGEIQQGKMMVDEAVEAGVKHFVYSSVDRGGDKKSWDNPTPVLHFQTKYEIEQHLKEKAGSMGWTVLRPVAFMDNLKPDFPTRVFMAAMRDTMNGKPVQWVAVKDIGVFAAKAFQSPEEFNHRAIGLAGDDLTTDQLSAVFKKETGSALDGTFWALGQVLKYMVGDLGKMLDWFGSDGYGADIKELRKIHPGLLDMGAWIQKESPFPKA